MAEKVMHLTGTNNRTWCGVLIGDKTRLLDDFLQNEKPYLATCRRCLGILAEDRSYNFGLYFQLQKEKDDKAKN